MSPADRNPALAEKISQMRLQIAPIVHVVTGFPPSDFPCTMLELFLLTEDQLDAFAHYYSQTTSTQSRYLYPGTMDWSRPILQKHQPGEREEEALSDFERLKVKMRMFARFIGMRGAETPMWEMERRVEILLKKIERIVEEEEKHTMGEEAKWYQGPSKFL